MLYRFFSFAISLLLLHRIPPADTAAAQGYHILLSINCPASSPIRKIPRAISNGRFICLCFPFLIPQSSI